MAKLPPCMGESFGQWLKARRESMGLSYRGFSDASGIPHSLIHHLETGEREPTPEVLDRLATFLGVDVAEATVATFPDRFKNPEYRRLLREWLASVPDPRD